MPTATNKFLCLCYFDSAKVNAWTPEQAAGVRDACAPHDRALHASGKLVLDTSISEPDTARVIRPTPKGPVVSKGAYASTPEPVGAMFIVEAADIDEAVRTASLHPGANLGQLFGGGIEVRAFDHFELPGGKSA